MVARLLYGGHPLLEVAVLKTMMGLALVLLSQTALSQTSLFGEPKVRGRACPEGSFAYVPTPTAFTFVFDSFFVEAGPGMTAYDMYKTCTITIPVEVPKGQQIAIDSIDYRGYASLDKGAHAILMTWYDLRAKGIAHFVSGKATTFRGPFQDEFFRRDAPAEQQWSACGGTHTLTLNAYLMTGALRKSQSYVQIDATDGAASVRAGVKTRKCK